VLRFQTFGRHAALIHRVRYTPATRPLPVLVERVG
jgi:hypothetical protein